MADEGRERGQRRRRRGCHDLLAFYRLLFSSSILFLLCEVPPAFCQNNQSCSSDDLNALRGFSGGLLTAVPGWQFNESSSSCCEWPGVACDPPTTSGRRVIGLDLGNLSLKGSVSESLAGLDHLRNLDLSANSLQGQLPWQLFRLQRLEILNVSMNRFVGEIPANLSLPAIQEFNISYNYISGSHPAMAGSSNLTSFDLTANDFYGVIDAGICNSSSRIRVLRFSFNNFSGEFPRGMKTCNSLDELSLGLNGLTGSLPDELFQMTSLTQVFLQQNNFSGNLSAAIGGLANLFQIDISLNQFSGFIPDVFSNLPKLQSFSAQSNKFKGDLPASMWSSPSLKVLNLNNNTLSGVININCTAMSRLSTLDLGSNKFSGPIPDDLPKCVQLRTLNLARNNLTGKVPESFKDFGSLVDLSLTGNQFSNISSALQILQQCPNLTSLVLTRNFRGGETMPSEDIKGFQKLELLVIANCALQGSVPQWFANLQQLKLLDISWNHLSGTIPPFFGNLDNLFYLDLSNNSLSGELPYGLTQMKSLMAGSSKKWQVGSLENFPYFVTRNSTKGLQYNQVSSFPSSLVLSNNKITGSILTGFGNLVNLQVLDLSWNNLSGTIPKELSGMSNLSSLILSHNNLTGSIPQSLIKLSFLSNFDVSYNNLVGQIPTGGQFLTFPSTDFEGNPSLCGLHLSPCISEVPSSPVITKRKITAVLIISVTISIVVGTAILICLIWVVVLRFRAKIMREDSAKVVAHVDESIDSDACSLAILFQNKDHYELRIDDIKASTNNFDQAHIIGCGGFGLVYKATLPDGRKVAIKRLTGDFDQMEREFQAEVETLSRAQHANLVLLQGYGRVGKDRLLIYTFMENGSLDYWLHEEGNSSLDWQRRLHIARGAARGLAYLHHYCEPHIVHRDIKSSNILLDQNFEAHLADFGLARLIRPYDTHVTTDLVGTLGYIPPEYAQSSVATRQGDIYSFGVVLLELLTGRRPVDMNRPRSGSGRDVVKWVIQMKRESREDEVFDPSIHGRGHDGELRRMLDIACLCVSESPRLRPSSNEVVAWLEGIFHVNAMD